jgi:imidazolonepropionase-like amidohydrolase
VSHEDQTSSLGWLCAGPGGLWTKIGFPPKALVGATLVDGTGAAAIRSEVVVINNGKITAAVPAGSTPVADGFEKINVSGKFIVPGLIDVHASADSDL